MSESNKQYKFNIALSVLNHLGRNLYRDFITIIGEAISNSWDADAENVWIEIDKEKNSFVIKDDGVGMTEDDFQNKFLKVGYTKRKKGGNLSKKGRPYIGRKGIGKLALLSCSKKISILTKTQDSPYTGGVIDNPDLDKAIDSEMDAKDYNLGEVQEVNFSKYTEGHGHGSIIVFDETNEGIKNSLEHLRKLIALYFQFSILDENFKIYLKQGEDYKEITADDLRDFSEKTQFLWMSNGFNNDYIEKLENLKESKQVDFPKDTKGFIASVEKPKDLTLRGAKGERLSINIFTNGRLREKNILLKIPSDRVAERYLYGEIHFDALDDGEKDRFTSSREGVLPDDEEYNKFLEEIKEVIGKIIGDWTPLRNKHNQDGDPDDPGKSSIEEAKASNLYNEIIKGFSKELLEKSEKKIKDNSIYNTTSYMKCFIIENLLREKISKDRLKLGDKAKKEIKKFKEREIKSKEDANINIPIREDGQDLSYLGMTNLAKIIEKPGNSNNINIDAKEYSPIRDAVAHTAVITQGARDKFKTVVENIKAKLI